MLHYPVSALLHEPFRRRSGTADANRLHTLEPGGIYLLGTLYEVAVGVYLLTAREECMPVAALATTDKEDEVVVGGKLRDMRHAVGNLAADGVEALKGHTGRDMRADIVDDATVFVKVLCRLGVEVDVA